jgi:hypothetical protein
MLAEAPYEVGCPGGLQRYMGFIMDFCTYTRYCRSVSSIHPSRAIPQRSATQAYLAYHSTLVFSDMAS